MSLKALTYVNLPVIEKRFSPGDEIPDADWEAAGQTDEDKANLIKDGAVSEDMDAPVHPDHVPVRPGAPSLASMVDNARELVERLGDGAPKELRNFAKLDVSHVVSGDKGTGASDAGN